MNTAHAETLDFQGISEHLKIAINDLRNSSKKLQRAVISRNVDDIWQTLAEQQNQMAEFDKYNYLWKQVVVDTGIDSPQIRKIKKEVNSELKKLKTTGKSSATLVRGFLAAIAKAFKRSTGNISNKSKIYGKKGKMAYKHSSMLVNRLG